MASSEAGAVLEGGIGEEDVREKSPPFHDTTEAEWHISDNHQQNLSFSDVRPTDITVRNLEVEVDVATSFVSTLKAKFTRSEVEDLEGGSSVGAIRKKILKEISADFPAGTLTAIIGGSGSGKVRPPPA
jgi:ABC-type glutathione transport system ATPase component